MYIIKADWSIPGLTSVMVHTDYIDQSIFSNIDRYHGATIMVSYYSIVR